MKKIFSLLVVVALSVTLISCRETVVPKGDPVQLTVYTQLANSSGLASGWFADELMKRFNVELLIVPDAEGTYETRMENGNLGDLVVWGADGDQYQNAVEKGMLFDWESEDLVQTYGPYIWENMQAALNKNREVSGDGNIYGFGHNVAFSSDEHESFFYTWDIRYDLYQRLGNPVVNDLDDYLQLMLDMKALEPTDEAGSPTYATSIWPDWDGNMVMYVKAFATAYWGYDELNMGLYDVETGQFYDALYIDPDTGEYGPYLKSLEFFNKLYQNDLLDPDSLTNTFSAATEKVANGGTFFSIFNYSGSDVYNTQDHIDENKMMLPMAPNEATPISYGMNVMGGNRVWSIGAQSQYPEKVMEIINWLATPEGIMTKTYGPQGVTWDYDEDGYTYYTELGLEMKNDGDTAFPEDSGYSGNWTDGVDPINNNTYSLDNINPDSPVGERFNDDYWASNMVGAKNDLETAWRTATGATDVQSYLEGRDYKVSLGSAYAESKQSSELKLLWAQVTNSIVNNSWNAMYAGNDAQFRFLVNEMIDQANNYGYDECLAWGQNEAALRYMAEEAVRNAS